ncbi:MAG: hypothetical protein LIQ26_00035 [Bacteroidota bacterium]|nr:hypothetical protein [Bacteroidota bacterium]
MKLFRHLLKGASLTSALFVFQACYGVPEPPLMNENGEAPMSFSLRSRRDGAPLEGIQIYARSTRSDYARYQSVGITDPYGKCRVTLPYNRNMEGPFLQFVDPSGRYVAKDTTLADLRDRLIEIKMDELPQ